MLTVKHVMPDGHEEIYAAVRAGATKAAITANEPRGQFHIETAKGDIVILGGEGDGVFYVMNDAGKTVAKYDFNPPQAAVIGGKPWAAHAIAGGGLG
jgi:hypothetical protein